MLPTFILLYLVNDAQTERWLTDSVDSNEKGVYERESGCLWARRLGSLTANVRRLLAQVLRMFTQGRGRNHA